MIITEVERARRAQQSREYHLDQPKRRGRSRAAILNVRKGRRLWKAAALEKMRKRGLLAPVKL